jgi:X-Pro dipeptidyl-peptidase (S15 family)
MRRRREPIVNRRSTQSAARLKLEERTREAEEEIAMSHPTRRFLRSQIFALIFLASPLVAHAAESASASTMWPGGSWTPPAATYGTKQDLQVAVPMSDGVELKADISYPTDLATGNRAAGPFPVLLTQTPYVSKKPTDGDYFVQRGYIYVTAYVRGTLTSGGSYGFFSERDSKDGAELVAWAAAKVQNSNGVVGLHGNSYMAITQLFTVAAAGSGSAPCPRAAWARNSIPKLTLRAAFRHKR